MHTERGNMGADSKLREAYAKLKALYDEVQRDKLSGTIGVQIKCTKGEGKQVRRVMDVA